MNNYSFRLGTREHDKKWGEAPYVEPASDPLDPWLRGPCTEGKVCTYTQTYNKVDASRRATRNEWGSFWGTFPISSALDIVQKCEMERENGDRYLLCVVFTVCSDKQNQNVNKLGAE